MLPAMMPSRKTRLPLLAIAFCLFSVTIPFMDISILKAIYKELADALPGTRIAALDEGESGEVCLAFKGAGKTFRLLINPRPPMPRIYFVKKPLRSKELSPFAQSLRNIIAGSEAESISQPGLERVISIQLSRNAERLTLLFEMAGKKPNLILLDGQGKVVLAQSYMPLGKVGGEEAQRPILPGLSYQPPPVPDKLDPLSLAREGIAGILQDSPGLPPEKALYQKIGGISPLLVREAVARAVDASPDAIFESLTALVRELTEGPYCPRIYEPPKGPALAAFGLRQFEGMPFTGYDSMSQAAEAFYGEVQERQEFASLKGALIKKLQSRLTSANKKVGAIKADLSHAEDAEKFQLYGSILMASPGGVEKGADAAILPNLFSEGERIEIPLDPKLSPIQNAEAYFKKARKARAGEAILRERLAATLKEAEIIETELANAQAAETADDLKELQGAPARGKLKVGVKAKAAPEFPSFISSDGYRVLYAKNAKMNDILTFKLAQPMDLWLHAQGYHGAHVIVQNPDRRPDVPLQTILEAAQVAAYYSGAKKDTTAAVDYTFKKYVRKPKDPAPGQAIFTNNKTVFVEPKKR